VRSGTDTWTPGALATWRCAARPSNRVGVGARTYLRQRFPKRSLVVIAPLASAPSPTALITASGSEPAASPCARSAKPVHT